VRNALVAGVELEVTADVLSQQPTPEELRAYYERHKDKYSTEGVMQLRDLLVKTDASHPAAAANAQALAAVAALRRGQSPDAVIKKFELVDSGRFMVAGHADTGDIFQFALRAKLDDALYQATLALHDGEVSDPVPESDGVHVIVMIKHRFPVQQTLEEASNQVWMDVKKEAQAKVRSANLTYLRSRADIILSPEVAP
jgi:peptidyl-prolyl cis-trans isomerase C